MIYTIFKIFFFVINSLLLIKSFWLMNKFTQTDSFHQLVKGLLIFSSTSFSLILFSWVPVIISLFILLFPNNIIDKWLENIITQTYC
jgi:hypothetical protein